MPLAGMETVWHLFAYPSKRTMAFHRQLHGLDIIYEGVYSTQILHVINLSFVRNVAVQIIDRVVREQNVNWHGDWYPHEYREKWHTEC